MKSIINVYKDEGLWQKPPPGIGDYLRGCAYLLYAAKTGPFAGRFEPGFNLDLATASQNLVKSDFYRPVERADLIEAREYFYAPRDGSLPHAIEAFLASDAPVFHISTNQSWRGVDDEPPREILDRAATVLSLTPEFEKRARDRNALFADYVLLHVRDADRAGDAVPTADELVFRVRAQQFVEQVIRNVRGVRLVCMSNNERLRDHLCQTYGLANAGTQVKNTGFVGVLSDAELMDISLMRGAKGIYALSYFSWNSGFSVWISRLFRIPALFHNAHSAF